MYKPSVSKKWNEQFQKIYPLQIMFFSQQQVESQSYFRVKMESEKVTKRVGSLIKLRPEFEEQYIKLHRQVFPKVLDRIMKSNIRNYSIFLS